MGLDTSILERLLSLIPVTPVSSRQRTVRANRYCLSECNMELVGMLRYSNLGKTLYLIETNLPRNSCLGEQGCVRKLDESGSLLIGKFT
jgi:hypothetical protein